MSVHNIGKEVTIIKGYSTVITVEYPFIIYYLV